MYVRTVLAPFYIMPPLPTSFHTHIQTRAFFQTLKNSVTKAGQIIFSLFNQLDRRLKSKDEKELLIGDLERSAGKSSPAKRKEWTGRKAS